RAAPKLRVDPGVLHSTSFCSTSPNSHATAAMPWPLRTRLTAISLNSAVYSCFGILSIANPHFVYPIQRHLEEEIRREAQTVAGPNTFQDLGEIIHFRL